MTKYLLILFFIIGNLASGQSFDSVTVWKHQLDISNSDTEKISLYSKLIGATLEKRPADAVNYLLDAYCTSGSILQLDAREDFNRYYLALSDYSQLRDSILQRRIETFKPGESKIHLAVYYLLITAGSIFRGYPEAAISYATKAGEIADELSEPGLNAEVAMMFFEIAISQGQFEKAKKEMDKILIISRSKGQSHYSWLESYCQILYYSDQSKNDSSLYYALEAIKVAPTEYHRAYCYGMAGIACIELGKAKEAIPYLNEAKEINLKLGNRTEYYRYLCKSGDAYIRTNHYQEAIDSLLKVKNELSIEEDSFIYLLAYKLLADAYSKRDDFKRAYEYHVRYLALYDSLNTIQSGKNIAEIQTKYETEKKDKELVLQNAMLRKQKMTNYFTAAFALLLIVLIGIVYRSYRQKKKSNADLMAAKERAEQSEKFKQQFLANMSHEIRTPMNAVMGMTELVLNSDLDTKQRKYLTGVKKASDNLLHIINDILDLSKIEAGKIELEHIEFSVEDLIQQVCDTLANKAQEKGIMLFSDISESVPAVLIGDAMRLNQVLMNLTGNAVKYTEKGSVGISVQSKSVSNTGQQAICFSITDTGIGIAKDKLEFVFESFSQAHASDTRKYGGTGLGLTISKQLVELMGGRISVESEEGSGSTFSFTLDMPVGSKENLLEQKSAQQIDGSILNGLRILLADDNTDNRIVARDTLESKAKLSIVEAINGQEVIDILTREDFDVILMDVQMPVMDGYEATRKIRMDFSGAKKNIPIIALTASVVRSDLDKCRAAGMNDYVPKPFKVHQLISAIARLTGKEIKYLAGESRQDKMGKAQSSTLPPLHAGSHASIVNLNYLEEFCEGDKIRMQKYINIFLDSAPVLIGKLQAGLKEENFEQLANQVHGFKTKWIMMGMQEASEIALKIELNCRKDVPDAPGIKTEIVHLVNILTDAIVELKLIGKNL